MNTYHILIVLSALVVLSYVFNLLASRLHVPAVLLLLGAGILLKETAAAFGYVIPDTRLAVELLGVTGLVLIVLEGALDLKLNRSKLPLVGRSFASALLILLASTGLLAIILHHTLALDWRPAVVYAVPLGVISSAIAIPSVGSLRSSKREFIIYESSFSDILGIMLFNYVVLENWNSTESVLLFIAGIAGILAVSIVSTLLLLLLLHHTKSHVKFFLVFAFLMLIYSFSKMLHWPSLLLVLVFGLALNNTHLFIRGRLARFFHVERVELVTKELKMMTSESAFLIRTFFFLLFGVSINLVELTERDVLVSGSLVLVAIILVRILFLRFISKTNLFPEMLIAPRGLITIILFYSIPPFLQNAGFDEGILLFVVVSSNLLMMLGLLAAGRRYGKELEEL